MSYSNHIALSIAGGDSLVGHALEQILQNAGYDARYLDDSVINSQLDPFEGASLVLIGPRTSGAKRKALLERLSNSMAGTVAVPVVELVGNGRFEDGPDLEGVQRVLWPCQFKVLKREIQNTLNSDGST